MMLTCYTKIEIQHKMYNVRLVIGCFILHLWCTSTNGQNESVNIEHYFANGDYPNNANQSQSNTGNGQNYDHPAQFVTAITKNDEKNLASGSTRTPSDGGENSMQMLSDGGENSMRLLSNGRENSMRTLSDGGENSMRMLSDSGENSMRTLSGEEENIAPTSALTPSDGGETLVPETARMLSNSGENLSRMLSDNEDLEANRWRIIQNVVNDDVPIVTYKENNFFERFRLNEELCDLFTESCIKYRVCYPYCDLPKDPTSKKGTNYNPCRRFVEPCFGISEIEYVAIKKLVGTKSF